MFVPRFNRLHPIALAITLLCSELAYAQAASEPAKAPAAAPTAVSTKVPTVQKVEVTGNADKYDARRDDTATKIVVTAEEIVKYGDTSLGDVLKRQPGITVSGGNAGRGGGEIRMRGLGSGYTQILLNGEAAPPGFSLDSLSPGMVERIEIVRAATAEFSTQSIAGTINIVLKKAIVTAQRELKLIMAGAKTYVSPSTSFQMSDKDGAMSWSLSGTVFFGTYNQDSSTIQDGSNASGVPNLLLTSVAHNEGRVRGLQFAPRVNWTLANGDTLTSQSFFNMNASNTSATNTWSAIQGSLPPLASDQTQGHNDSDFLRTDLNWVHKITGGAKLDTKLGLNASLRHIDFYQQGQNAAKAPALDSQTISDARDHGLTFTGKFTTPYIEDHSLATGWDGGSSQRSESRVQDDKTIAGYIPVHSNESYDATVNRLAVFAQDEWSVTPKWSVYFGLRWEGLDTVSAGTTYSEVHNRSSVLSPLFQTLWKLPDSKSDQVRFALTRTYKAPATSSLIPRRFTATNNSPTTPDTQGNPALRPELAWGLDTSFEHFFATPGAMMSISAYARRIDDFNRRGLALIDARWVSMPVNDGRANTHGVEMEAKFPLQLFWKEGPAIDLRANLNRNWSTVEDVPGPDNRLASQTPLSANFGLDYKMNNDFSAGGNFTYKSGGPVRISATQSTYSTIRREMDIYALWKFDAKNQLRITAVNVLAQDWTNLDQYADANGRLRTTTVYPGTAFLRASWELKF
jgi:outer membrane receptor protein involved in Fe transport